MVRSSRICLQNIFSPPEVKKKQPVKGKVVEEEPVLSQEEQIDILCEWSLLIINSLFTTICNQNDRNWTEEDKHLVRSK